MEEMFFQGWFGLLRTLIVGILAYVVLVVFLRISGLRTLSKMNAFDLVVTVALGSILANILLNKDVALAEGAVAFGVLIALQFLVTWSSVRTRWVRKLVTGEPAMLVYRGTILDFARRQIRVTEDEIHAAVRSAGLLDLEQVEAVVLETDGSFTVVEQADKSGASSLESVRIPQSKDGEKKN
jgi:uncharacterized membrane protein YcaP (DUF421 family)